jgi:hypothetical protein
MSYVAHKNIPPIHPELLYRYSMAQDIALRLMYQSTETRVWGALLAQNINSYLNSAFYVGVIQEAQERIQHLTASITPDTNIGTALQVLRQVEALKEEMDAAVLRLEELGIATSD